MEDQITFKPLQELSYDEAIKELELIVQKLQRSDCGMDQLQALTQRSIDLLAICKEKLTGIDDQLQLLMGQIDA